MTAAIDDLRTAIHLDLLRAHRELAEARLRQRQKDSPSNRAALATCLTTMDTVLDAYLAAKNLRRQVSGRAMGTAPSSVDSLA